MTRTGGRGRCKLDSSSSSIFIIISRSIIRSIISIIIIIILIIIINVGRLTANHINKSKQL